MKILNKGNGPKWVGKKCRCPDPECRCFFQLEPEDKKKVRTENNDPGHPSSYVKFVVNCPECGGLVTICKV